jgi:tRNA (cmo5U34)-methyltransferase
MSQDELFRRQRTLIDDFDFGKETAEVFDDMLARSIPFYGELQRMIAELAADFAQDGTTVYDLGCSTGTTLATLDRAVPGEIRLVGIDSSPDMLERARGKLEAATTHRPVELLCLDLERGVPVHDASLVVMILTLQFIRPLRREAVIADIAQGLVERGALILVEKVLSGNSLVNRLFIEHYYDFKRRNGYSDMEIAQKREALENVLVPYHDAENRELLLRNGFRYCEPFFRWYNFCGILAIK